MLNFLRAIYKEWGVGLITLPMSMAMIGLSICLARGSQPASYWTAGLVVLSLALCMKLQVASENGIKAIAVCTMLAVFSVGAYVAHLHTGAFLPFTLQYLAFFISFMVIRGKPEQRQLVSARMKFGPGDAQLLFVLCALGGTLLAVKSHAGFSPALSGLAATVGLGQVVYVLQKTRSPITHWVLLGGAATLTFWLAITGQTTLDFFIWCVLQTALFAGFEYRFRTALDTQKRTDPYNVLGQQ